MGSKLFGDRPATAISVVEPSLSRWYAKRARLVFYVVSIVVGLASAGVLSLTEPVAAAVFLGALIGAAIGFAAAVLVRVWPVLRALWWWALEIVSGGLILVAVVSLASVLSLVWALVALVVAVAVVLWLLPPLRKRLAAWIMCATVRHRLRFWFSRFQKGQKANGPASLPLILLARSTPAGERVWIWLRGVDLAGLEGSTGLMAVTCWSSEVRLARVSEKHANLIRVDITRRDSLRDLVISPLLQRFGLAGMLPIPVSPGPLPSGLDLDDVPEVFEEVRPSRR